MKVFPWQKPYRGALLNTALDISKGLLGCWVMNEGAGDVVHDSSGKRNDGVKEAGVLWSADSLLFSGDKIDAGTMTALEGVAAFTVSFRVFPTATADYKIVAGMEAALANDTTFIFRIKDNNFQFYVPDGAAWGTPVSISVTANKWYDFTGVYDGVTYSLYQNGKPVGTPQARTGATNSSTDNFLIGDRALGGRGWAGLMNFGMVWTKALTPSEIKSLTQDPYQMFVQKSIGFSPFTLLPVAWGEESPTANETPISWTAWSNGEGGSVSVTGDSDWGQLALSGGGIAHSPVVTNESSATRGFTVSQNLYGSGEGSFNVFVRGSNTSFSQDAATPSWESYSDTVDRSWKYSQVRLVGA